MVPKDQKTIFLQRLVAFSFMAMILSVMSFKPATAASVNYCKGYANSAVNQFKTNLRLGCGYTGFAWHNWKKGHYNWCRATPKGLVAIGRSGRTSKLAKCRRKKGGGFGGLVKFCRIKKVKAPTKQKARAKARAFIAFGCKKRGSKLLGTTGFWGNYTTKYRCCQ